MKVTVCMATYNGEKTIKKQILSILNQLTAADEFVVVDDCSTDETLLEVKQSLAQFEGKKIVLINEVNQGPIKSFEKALKKASGDLIFLSDQDDEWHLDKVAKVKNEFQTVQSDLIIHDAIVLDKKMDVIDKSWNHYNHNQLHQGVVTNLVKNGYTGAMMAVSKRLLDKALPFPGDIEMHDQWLFLVAKKYHFKISILDEALMDYVRHGGNVTGMSKRAKSLMFMGRLNMLKDYLLMRRH